ncbi:MAG: hypothetical protein KOO63_13660 [Bacteroidales bacterium]|nr:hypothetical protein [Candidatus Latescibacterota bacterium]
MTDVEFKGWEIPVSDLENMLELCKTTGMKSMVFGTACMERDEVVEFIDPNGGEYKYGSYKLFIKGYIVKSLGLLCAFPLAPAVTYFDEFPPIPPEPFKDGP